MICPFQIGQKVVCVGDYTETSKQEWAVILDVQFPKLGSVYTIREMRPGVNGAEDESVGLVLDELENSEHPTSILGGVDIDERRTVKQEPAFDWRDFRPLNETKSDISIFTSLLSPSKQPVPA